MSKQICTVNWDDCYSVSTEENSVYFDVTQTKKGWYLSVDLDCDSAHFTEVLAVDDGPYPTEEAALHGGLSAAYDWMYNNGHYGDYTVDTRLIRRGLASNPEPEDEDEE
jgi:hypothetical protein